MDIKLNMKILCCGSRDFTNIEMIVDRLDKLPTNSTIIHGGAKGADTICHLVAREFGMDVESYPAKWGEYGKRAGVIRNIEMLNRNPDLVLAFRSKENSRGTNHTILHASKRNIKTEIFDDFKRG